MKILYVDTVETISKIRIAEKSIFIDELKKNGDSVDCLLRTPNLKELINDNNSDSVYYYPNNFLSKLYLNLPLLFSLIRIKQLNKYDYIITRNSICISFVPLIIAKLNRVRFLYVKAFPTDLSYLHSFYNDKNLNKKVINGIRYLFHYLIDFFLLRLSDKVITRTDAYSEYLRRIYHIRNKEFYALPMGFEKSNFICKEELILERPDEISSGCRYIGYFGSLAAERNLSFVLTVLASIITKHPDVRLILLGALPSEMETITTVARNHGVLNYVVVKEEIGRCKLYSYLKHVKFTISAIPPYPMYKISSPTKVVESLGLGIPVIVNEEIIDQADLIKKTKFGMVVSYDVESFVQATTTLLLNINGSILEENRSNAMLYIHNNRSYSRLAKDLFNYMEAK